MSKADMKSALVMQVQILPRSPNKVKLQYIKKSDMKVSTVKDVLAMEDGKVIEAFRGVVTEVFPRISSGPKEQKPWSFDPIKVKDKHGDEMRVVFASRDPLPDDVKGKELTLLSFRGAKGWSGVRAVDNVFMPKGAKKPVTTREIKVTSTAEVVWGNGAKPDAEKSLPKESDVPADEEQDYKPLPKKHAERDEGSQEDRTPPVPSNHYPPKGSSHHKALTELRVFAAKRRTAWMVARSAAIATVQEEDKIHHDVPVSPQEFTAMVLAFYNSGCFKEGLYDALPVDANKVE